MIPMTAIPRGVERQKRNVRGQGFGLCRAALIGVLVVAVGACVGTDGEISLIADVTTGNSEARLGFARAGEEVTGNGPTLAVPAGEEVTVTVENNDSLGPHNFAIVPELDDIAKAAALGSLDEEILWDSSIVDLSSGDTESVTFTPGAPGDYYYVCTLPGHAAAGMMGEFVVTES